MPRLFILVGIPGCGKSTYAHILRHSRCTTVNTDVIRQYMVSEGKLASINDMSRNDAVFARYHENIAWMLDRNWDVIADATNLRDYAREALRKIAELENADMHVIVFNNLNEAIERNQNRERVVPPDVMGSMLEQHEKALRDIPTETYTSVVYIESLT